MTLTLYSATVPAYLQLLPAVLGMIGKAEDHCQAHGLPAAELIEARLAPDMWNFAEQIRAVALHSASALNGAIAGDLEPEIAPPPADFAGLRRMIETALAQVKAVTPEQIDPLPGEDIILRFGAHKMEFVTEDFLLSFAGPNFFFHASIAYAILRMKGVPVGKGDFIGAVRSKAPVAA